MWINFNLFKAFCLVICCAVVIATHVEAAEKELETILNKIQAQYNSIHSLKAEFEQSSFQAMLQETVTEKGWLAIDKPDRMIWSYTDPGSKTALIEGPFIWLYVASDKHLYCETSENFSQHLFYQLISGNIILKETFTFSLVEGADGPPQDDFLNLKLVPLDKHPTIQHIIVSVDRQFMIRKTAVHDHFGNVTTCLLSGYVLNPDLPDTTFRLVISRPVTITDFTGAKMNETIVDRSEAVSFKGK